MASRPWRPVLLLPSSAMIFKKAYKSGSRQPEISLFTLLHSQNSSSHCTAISAMLDSIFSERFAGLDSLIWKKPKN